MKPITDPPDTPPRPRRAVINTARSEEPAEYLTKHLPQRYTDLRADDDKNDDKIAEALRILTSRLKEPGRNLSTPSTAKDYLRLHYAGLEHETFTVLFLDVKNRVIALEDMFTGTLTHTSVYPREVVKAALKHNAAAVMLAHNHPSGHAEPSQSDLLLTRALVQALALVDVRVLDHFVVAGAAVHSFAEHGQI